MDWDDSMSQLRMAWPMTRLESPPELRLHAGYTLRSYRPGDETRFYEVMALAGWPGWDDERLRPWLARIIPGGWFMIVDESGAGIVATAMALHNYQGTNPFQGELGWLASDPAHAGRGLGRAVSAAVTRRLIEAGYRQIRLYSEDFRLAALKIYLSLGYVPELYEAGMAERWREVCTRLDWPFTPEAWDRNLTDHFPKD